MNISMLTNMLTANVAAGPVASKPTAIKNAPQVASADTAAATTTDNILTTTQNKPINESSKQFQYTLGKKIDPKSTQKSKSKLQLGTEAPPEQLVSPENQEQPVSAQEPVTPDSLLDKAVVANMDSSDQQQAVADILAEPAQSVNVSETFQLSALLAQASRQTTIEPGQVVSADSGRTVPEKAASGQVVSTISPQTIATTSGQLVPAAPQTENGPLQLTTGQNQIDSEVVLPDSSPDILTTGTDQPQGKTILLTNPGANQQGGKELITETLAAEGKTTATDEKPAIVDPSTSEGPKTPSVNDALPLAEPKVALAQANLVESGSQDSTVVLEKPTNGEVDVPQQPKVLSDSSNDGKDLQPAENNPTGQALPKDLNPEQMQISVGQPKGRNSSNPSNSSDSDTGQFSQVISSNDLHPFTAEQTSVSEQAAKPPADVSTGLGRQIQESISSSLNQGEQQITIRLNPPELGNVFIKFQTQADEITGTLQVSNAQTRYEVEQALPEVIRNLADSGIEVGRLEVVISDAEQAQQQAAKDQSLASGQNGWFGQNSSQNSDTPSNNPDNADNNQWLTNIYDYTGLTEPQQMLVTDESINMLV